MSSSGNTSIEDTAESYTKAANKFKLEKSWERACDAYSKAAECNIKEQSKYEAATNYINAGKCIRNDKPEEAIRLYRIAIELFIDEGRFSMVAKHQKEIAEFYEAEMKYEQAMEEYQKAADLFGGESSTSSENGCLLKVAQFAAQLEDYDKACEIFEKIAKVSVDDNLLKWGVKECLLKAGLCYLAKDIVAAHKALEQFQDLDYSFSSQRECKFLQDLINACDKMDSQEFTQVVGEFDNISKLDPWKVTILLRIKQKLKSEESMS